MRNESGWNSVVTYLGITKTNFLIRMQNLRQPDMNTDNFGTYWSIDHIVPLRLFDLNNEDDVLLAWNHYNLMPMYTAHNFEKEHCLHISEELLSYLPDNEFTLRLKQKVDQHKVNFNIYKDNLNAS